MIEQSLQDIDWAKLIKGRAYYPSPATWEDEVLYFLFVDRFSDGKEFGGFSNLQGRGVNRSTTKRSTPLFDVNTDVGNADRTTWFEAVKTWCGGTFAGIKDKLGYLKRLGITAIWLSPIFRQVTGSDDYHGYGIQNFLDVDPHFGTREELKTLVEAAHNAGIRIILDIILNHAGNVFAYNDNHRYFYFEGRQWPVAGFRTDQSDPGSLPFLVVDTQVNPQAWPEQAVWPREFQLPEAWTQQGEIRGWDSFPEYLDGDFLSLKEIYHGQAIKDPASAWDVQRRIREFQPAAPLSHLIDVYKFWMAYADIDGYRIDTVKHMEPGAVRFFANAIHEFAASLGKEHFYLIGEITGGRANAVNILNTTGLDAALGINDIPDKLENLAKGWRSPGDPRTETQEGYFDLFRNSLLDQKNSHQWFGKHVVTMFDDHDQVGVQHKYRFCGDRSDSHKFLPAVLGLNLTTVGIPCLYYGTEQAFNGADHREGQDDSYSDVFLRECLFGGPFGSLQSTERHFFNEQHSAYRLIQEVCALRRRHIALRRGRQYLRSVSATGNADDFHYPQPLGGQLRWVVAWSRIFADQEYLCAINTDAKKQLRMWVTIDQALNPAGKKLTCLFSTKPSQKGLQVRSKAKNGSTIQITVPAAGFVVYH
ncbi:MAG: alpha-amylase family glycosyl hydrolase [Nitrospirae bacterium]|nr:alpha-amylase family glycosyl hydrolase [Nitrospirota bacterium]